MLLPRNRNKRNVAIERLPRPRGLIEILHAHSGVVFYFEAVGYFHFEHRNLDACLLRDSAAESSDCG